MIECIMCENSWDYGYNSPDAMDLSLLKAIYKSRRYPFDISCYEDYNYDWTLIICEECITAPVYYCVNCHATHVGMWVYFFVSEHIYDHETKECINKEILTDRVNKLLADRDHKHNTTRTDSLCYDCMKPYLSTSVIESIDRKIEEKPSFDDVKTIEMTDEATHILRTINENMATKSDIGEVKENIVDLRREMATKGDIDEVKVDMAI